MNQNNNTIFFDARHILKGGIGIYIRAVLRRLIVRGKNVCIIIQNEKDIKEYLVYKNVSYLVAPKLFSIAEQIWFIANYKKFYNQIYISPYLTFPLFVKIKLIFIVYDVIWLIFPEYATGKLGYLYFKLFTTIGVKRSIKIITISENTKNDICKIIKISENKIDVLYVGFDREEFINVHTHNKNGKHFIYVGSWKPWKNVPLLLQAFLMFLEIKGDENEVQLILCGDNDTNKSDDILGLINTNDKLIKNVVITKKVERLELLRWIKGSIALIQPSKYEGFGMAVIEGLVLDVPVICSDIPVFKEIAQGNVEYFQSGNAEDLAQKMLAIYLQNKNGRPAIKTDKEAIFAKYNWEKIADKLIQESNT